MALPSYASPGERVWYVGFRILCAAIFLFLIAPLLVIVPLSFNAQPYFTFTPEMLALDPVGYSGRWYRDIIENDQWLHSIRNSLLIGSAATLMATTLGTLAALGLNSPAMTFEDV